MKNKEKFNVVYAGTNPLVNEIMGTRFPGKRLMQYSNKEDFEKDMVKRAKLFNLLVEGGSRLGAEGLVYPDIVLSDPDLPLKYKPSKTSPCGPGMIKSISGGLVVSKAYVLVTDEAYDSNLKGLRSCCEEYDIDVVRTSELEGRLEELLKD